TKMSYIPQQRPELVAAHAKLLWPEWQEHCHDIVARHESSAPGANDRLKIMLMGKPELPLYPKGKLLGAINLTEQPACCGTAVSTYTALSKELRGKGLGRKLLYLKEQLAMHLGYSALQITAPWSEYDMDPQTAEIHIIRSTPGWELDYTFVNRRTFNVISVF